MDAPVMRIQPRVVPGVVASPTAPESGAVLSPPTIAIVLTFVEPRLPRPAEPVPAVRAMAIQEAAPLVPPPPVIQGTCAVR